jgi:hypothetical protein
MRLIERAFNTFLMRLARYQAVFCHKCLDPRRFQAICHRRDNRQIGRVVREKNIIVLLGSVHSERIVASRRSHSERQALAADPPPHANDQATNDSRGYLAMLHPNGQATNDSRGYLAMLTRTEY